MISIGIEDAYMFFQKSVIDYSVMISISIIFILEELSPTTDKEQSMKKMILSAVIFGLSVNLFAATDTANLKLLGKVEATTSITFKTGDSIDRDVNILAGENNKLLDTAKEESNSHTGYSVSVRTANKGLKHQNVNVNYGYTLMYGTQSVNITPTGNQEFKLIDVGVSTQKVTHERDVKINLEAQPLAPSGNYQDTLTFTIATNG